jgi:hypothetical protein
VPVNWIFEVLDLLGDPSTISDVGGRADPGPNGALVYVFGNGLVADAWSLRLEEDVVVEQQRLPAQ